MGFAVFDMFFVLTGAVALRVLQVAGIHVDAVSVCLLLFNFSVRAFLHCVCVVGGRVCVCVCFPPPLMRRRSPERPRPPLPRAQLNALSTHTPHSN